MLVIVNTVPPPTKLHLVVQVNNQIAWPRSTSSQHFEGKNYTAATIPKPIFHLLEIILLFW
jgi:hypothetical protein